MPTLKFIAKRFPLALLLAPLGCGAGNFGDTNASNSSTTTTTLAVSPTSVTAGTSVALSATVSPATAGGSVNFLDGTSSLGSAAVNGGRASLSVATLSNGAHSISASYGGMLGYYASSSAGVNVYVSPMLNTSSITLTASPASATVGTNILLTSTVTTGATGVVTFFDGASSLGSAVITNSVAVYNTALLSTGTHNITAVYGGSTSYAGATSAAVVVTLQ